MSEITYLKITCERCGGHIEYPAEMAARSIQCPHCQHTITLPSRFVSPPIPPQPRPVPSSATQPARRHGIFYYVFWGTISLFVTLAILFVGFLFLTGAGAAFLVGLSHRPATVQNRTTTTAAAENLPALTDAEFRQARSLLKELHVERDDIEGVSWYSPEPAGTYKTAVYLYIGQKQARQPQLRWKIRYYGDGWLFIHRFRIKIDEAEATGLLPTTSLKHETGDNGSVWEIFDEPANKHAHLLNQIMAGNIVYLRMEGTSGNKDIELLTERQQIAGRSFSLSIFRRHMASKVTTLFWIGQIKPQVNSLLTFQSGGQPFIFHS